MIDPIQPPTPNEMSLQATIKLQERYILSDPSQARKTLMLLLETARKGQDAASEAYILCLLSGAAFFQGNYNDTLLLAEYGLRISRREKLRALESRCLNVMGLATTRLGKYDDGLSYFRQSLAIGEEIGDDASRARAMINMGSTYSTLEIYPRALSYFQQGASLASQCKALQYLADANSGIVEALLHLDREEEALQLLDQTLELATMIDFKSVLWKLRQSQARLALDERRLMEALNATQLGLSIAQETNDYEGQAVMRTLLGECYFNLAQYDQAKTELRRGERLAQAIGLQRIGSIAKRHLARLSEIEGDPYQALTYLKAHLEIEEQLQSTMTHRLTQALSAEIRDELQRREHQLQLQKNEELSLAQSMLDQTRDELLHQSAHDQLTEVLNRSNFWWITDKQLSDWLQEQEPFVGLILADIKELRSVNEQYGTMAGDIVLKTVSQRLQKLVDPKDIVGRLNGDEFIIMVTGSSTPESLDALTAALHSNLSVPVNCGDVLVDCEVSLGYVIAPQDGRDLDTLHRNAEIALRHAKQNAQGVVRFTTEIARQELVRRQLIADLPHALRKGEFVLHYQAQYRLSDQQLTGFESLVRWEHPTLGPISPQLFIQLAEDSGQIADLGRWILREACRQASEWAFPSLKLRMAVNISPIQFSHPDFSAQVQEILNECGISGECLTLEITEGMIHRSIAQAIDTSRRLQDLGIKVAMDDFGTGYSSLNVLNRFPLDILKIDREFMTDLFEDHPGFSRARHLIGSIISLASGLGLQVIAEGIESVDQLQILRELGCDMAQGYALARPSAAPDVAFRLPLQPSADQPHALLN